METVYLELQIIFGLYSSCMEGRSGYKSGIRPNHWIPGRDYAFPGQLEFYGKEIVAPGEDCAAVIKCMVPKQDAESFKPGFTWHVCEANKIMGYARVV